MDLVVKPVEIPTSKRLTPEEQEFLDNNPLDNCKCGAPCEVITYFSDYQKYFVACLGFDNCGVVFPSIEEAVHDWNKD